MKKLFLFAGIAAMLISCTPKNAEEAKTGEAQKVEEKSGEVLNIASESMMHWRGKKVGGEHYGVVAIKSGSIKVQDGNINGGTLIIDLNSIVSEDLEGEWYDKLVGHLKSSDFFNVAEYPEATFEIVKVEKFIGETDESLSAPTHEFTGNLTIKGMAKSISFPATIAIEDGIVKASSNEFAIDRTLWNINFKSKTVFAEFKDDYINDMINLKFEVEFSK